MKTVALVALLGVPAIGHAAQAQRPAAPPAPATAPNSKAEAYKQFLLAQRLESARDHEGAIGAYRRAIALDPQSAELPASLADLFLDLNRVDEARTAANRALTIDSANRDAHRVLGTLFAAAATSESREARQARAQNLASAIDHLEQAAAERPGQQADPNVRAMLARLHILNGAYDKAISLLSDLVRQEPGWQEGAGLLVDAYVSAGRTAEAVSWLEQAAEDNPELNASLGDLYGRIQRWQDAANAYERALGVSARSFDLRVRYASMLMNAGGVENALRAREVLRQAVQMRGTDERALYMLSNAERQTHDLDAAETTARRLIKQNAKNPRGYYALA